MPHTVDDMCKAGCTSRRGVRYWEDQGLLGTVERTSGNQRKFTDAQLDKARIIAAAQFGGWTLEECKEMLEAYDDEAHEAILHRLMQQATLAAKLAEDLPVPSETSPAKAFDL
jgi:DNA-binding transcriptional MerR regulator